MRSTNRFLGVALSVGLVLFLAACAAGDLDSGNSADVVLAIQNAPTIPPVTASPAADGSGCVFTVTPAQVTMTNLPKTELAQSPYSDIVMDQVYLTYSWVSVAGVASDVQPVSGLIPVKGSQSVAFTPIRLDYIDAALSGSTAGLTLVFHGHTVDGHQVQTSPISGVQLSINQCVTTSVCGNGTISGPEQCDDANTNSGDGCSSSCQIEPGYCCLGQPSICSLCPGG